MIASVIKSLTDSGPSSTSFYPYVRELMRLSQCAAYRRPPTSLLRCRRRLRAASLACLFCRTPELQTAPRALRLAGCSATPAGHLLRKSGPGRYSERVGSEGGGFDAMDQEYPRVLQMIISAIPLRFCLRQEERAGAHMAARGIPMLTAAASRISG